MKKSSFFAIIKKLPLAAFAVFVVGGVAFVIIGTMSSIDHEPKICPSGTAEMHGACVELTPKDPCHMGSASEDLCGNQGPGLYIPEPTSIPTIPPNPVGEETLDPLPVKPPSEKYVLPAPPSGFNGDSTKV